MNDLPYLSLIGQFEFPSISCGVPRKLAAVMVDVPGTPEAVRGALLGDVVTLTGARFRNVHFTLTLKEWNNLGFEYDERCKKYRKNQLNFGKDGVHRNFLSVGAHSGEDLNVLS